MCLEDALGVLMSQIEDMGIEKRTSLRFLKAMASVKTHLMCGHSDKHYARQITSPAVDVEKWVSLDFASRHTAFCTHYREPSPAPCKGGWEATK